MKWLQKQAGGLLHLFFPNYCYGCGADVASKDQLLCLHCLGSLPETGFFRQTGNLVEKVFYGRLPLRAAGALYYFTKQSVIQELMHQLKYKSKPELGVYLGKMLGHRLLEAENFPKPDCIIPVPLSRERQYKRGYNQSAETAAGVAEVLGIPVLNNALVRNRASETQTHKTREERWENMQGIFSMTEPELINNRRVLLLDDVVTTGATLEACGTAILSSCEAELSVAAIACA
jgi:ComF family protein